MYLNVFQYVFFLSTFPNGNFVKGVFLPLKEAKVCGATKH